MDDLTVTNSYKNSHLSLFDINDIMLTLYFSQGLSLGRRSTKICSKSFVQKYLRSSSLLVMDVDDKFEVLVS